MQWTKSTRCADSACVEMGTTEHMETVLVRNSTEPTMTIEFDKETWRGLLQDIRAGRFEV